MNKPKVSVIMAAYNSGKYIEESILSILNQTLKDLELIIIDDCSTDNVPDLIKKYQVLDPRIIAIRNEKNLGSAKPMVIGIKLARADYVAMMDSDDVAYPNRLEIQYNFMEQNPNVALIGSGVELMNESGQILKRRIGLTDYDEIKFRILLRNPFIHPSTIYRRAIFEEMGGYDKKYENSEDYALFSAIAQKYKIAGVPQILLKYRMSPNSVTRLPKSRKIQLETSYRINEENINKYLNLSEIDVHLLVDTVNRRRVSLAKMVKSLIIYKKLVRQYIKKEKLDPIQTQKVLKIYKLDKEMAVGSFIKTRWQWVYTIAKYCKNMARIVKTD